jgi:hypothetical protein
MISHSNFFPVSTLNSGSQHWQSLIDTNGILGPDGQPISLTTVVAKTADAYKLTAVFDTGFSLPQVPEWVASLSINFSSRR